MELSAGDTAWVLASTALVLLMTPGLAFFYGGMTKAKSTLNMMMMSFAAIAIVSILWVVYGFSLAFGNSGSGYYGAFSLSGLSSAVGQLTNNGGMYGIPLLAFAGFQLMFAVITPALISGAIADRAKFLTWCIFIVLWVTIVYFPVAHWVFDFGDKDAAGNITGAGWLASKGVLDFAGGTAVHINAGAAGLALMDTQVATAAALGGWLIVERIRDGHATSIGAASGAVAGLVAITPACAFVAPWAAVVLGLVAGCVCSCAVGLKYKLNYDDSLDVVGIHLVGGIVGMLFIGFFSTTVVNSVGANGVFYGGGFDLLGKQALGVVAVAVYSFVVTLILGVALEKTLGFRITRDAELEGIDFVEHAESACGFQGLIDSGFINGELTTQTKWVAAHDDVLVEMGSAR